MSTKIYNGYRVRGTLADTYRLCLAYRAKVKEWAEEEMIRVITAEAVGFLDSAVLAGTRLGGNAIDRAWNIFTQHYRQCRTEREPDPAYDVEAELAVSPGPRGFVLVRLFVQREELTRMWESMERVSPYPYWSISDRPPEVPPREWKARARAWGKMVDRDEGRAFVFQCLGPYAPIPKEFYRPEFIPPMARRVRAQAQERTDLRYSAETRDLPVDPMRIMHWLYSRKRGAEIQKAEAEIAPLLPATYSREALMGT